MENMKRYEREGTSREREGARPNINKGRPGGKRTVRTEETIKIVVLYIENNARYVRRRRSGL